MSQPKFVKGDLVILRKWNVEILCRVHTVSGSTDFEGTLRYDVERLDHIRKGYDKPGIPQELVSEREITAADHADAGMLW